MRSLILSLMLMPACTSLVPNTVTQLNRMDPTIADPQDFAIMIEMPEGLDFIPGSAQLRFMTQRTDTGESRSETFMLEQYEQTFAVADADLVPLRTLQATARRWKAENPDASNGSMGVWVAPCVVGDGPASDARVSVSIRMEQDGPFMPLVRNGPISAVAGSERIGEMKECP